jgi:putative transposase
LWSQSIAAVAGVFGCDREPAMTLAQRFKRWAFDDIKNVESRRGRQNHQAMHSFTSCFIHCVWSTKNREPLLTPDLRNRLWPYLGGIAKQNQMKTLAIGGASDHVHVLLSLPATLSIAKAMQLLKGNSSKWLRETFPKMRSFAWQEGYGAFSIGVSGVDTTVAYIRNQAEHHRTRSFRDEFVAMLKKHGFEYEESLLT